MNPLQIAQEQGLVDEPTIEKIQSDIADNSAAPEVAMITAGVQPDAVRQVFSEYYQVPSFAIPEGFRIEQEILNYIPEDSAEHYKVMPLKVEDDVLIVGANDPDNLQMREALNFISAKHNQPYKLVFMLESDIEQVHAFYQNLEGDVGDALETLESELDAEIAASLEEADDSKDKQMEHIEEDAPVTKIVATILRYAVDGGASDIHIEPNRQQVNVRFRVDGDLAKSLELPKNVHMAVVARVKILSSMRLDERRRPQDGRFSATFDGRKIDFRVSVLPTNHGEKVVMRILDNDKGVRTLADTGIAAHNLAIIKRMVKVPYGIILISGPTGSGKSTTLYGMLNEVDKLTKNVLSLEDPVEYNINGVSQSQVRPEIGYTFAQGLRAALRQDPDIIMVGEIRDKETAQLAIQAALTGHLVLSTIHTNNAIGVIPRLIDMGVDPYLIAPTLKLAIAQRLARTLCEGTGKVEPIPGGVKQMMQETFSTLPEKYRSVIPQMDTIIHPEPSASCATGMKGRTAVTEVLEINEAMQELILRNASEEEFYAEARTHGFISMQEDAIIKGLNHEIPYEEMNAFSTRLAIETMAADDEATTPVDNPNQTTDTKAIMSSNEDSSR
ncbi:type II/IV secretion system protein [Candidatus Kaiserbacteria bacterium]|nr:type II/IV secretion system protein [Candidatus Kaiserbacteria bacterium]